MATHLIGFRSIFAAAGPPPTPSDRQHFHFTFKEHSVEFTFGKSSPIPFFHSEERRGWATLGKNLSVSLVNSTSFADTQYKESACVTVTAWREISDLPEDPAAALPQFVRTADHKAFKTCLRTTIASVGIAASSDYFFDHVQTDWVLRRDDGQFELSTNSGTFIMVPPIRMICEADVAQLLKGFGKKEDQHTRAMEWLIKAWTERDQFLHFLALFIPIELLLEGYSAAMPFDPDAKSILDLIEKSAFEQKNRLIRRMHELLKPTLAMRFQAMADRADFDTKAEDVEVFRRANTLRNAMVHRGHGIDHFTKDVHDRTKELRPLVERYLRWALNTAV